MKRAEKLVAQESIVSETPRRVTRSIKGAAEPSSHESIAGTTIQPDSSETTRKRKSVHWSPELATPAKRAKTDSTTTTTSTFFQPNTPSITAGPAQPKAVHPGSVIPIMTPTAVVAIAPPVIASPLSLPVLFAPPIRQTQRQSAGYPVVAQNAPRRHIPETRSTHKTDFQYKFNHIPPTLRPYSDWDEQSEGQYRTPKNMLITYNCDPTFRNGTRVLVSTFLPSAPLTSTAILEEQLAEKKRLIEQVTDVSGSTIASVRHLLRDDAKFNPNGTIPFRVEQS